MPVLGDRVANLSFRQAPLGLRGTVVGRHSLSGYVEVVFDEEFVGGTTLGAQCSNGKGALAVGAFDERVALTIPQESGSGGSAS